jgi:hypothetical protein
MSTAALRRRFASGGVWGRWTVAWLGSLVLGTVNGSLREILYKDSVGDLPAHYISTATLMVLLALYIWMLEQSQPIPSWPGACAWVCVGERSTRDEHA